MDKQRIVRQKRGMVAETMNVQGRRVRAGGKPDKNSSSMKQIGVSFVVNNAGHDILHGSAKSAIYAALRKRLQSTA